MKPIDRVLETCLYVTDLDAAEQFYVNVLGLERYSGAPGRHVFFRCGNGMFLVFNPARTSAEASLVSGAPVPTHGATGPGHVAFAVPDADIPLWRARLEHAGIAIESEVTWPRGGRSLYVRDPAGTVWSSRHRSSGDSPMSDPDPVVCRRQPPGPTTRRR